MKLFNYTVAGSCTACRPITRATYQRDYRSGVSYIGWWKFVVWWGKTRHCEYCGIENGLYRVCEACYEHHFCECGQELTDSSGSPGDGFCRACD